MEENRRHGEGDVEFKIDANAVKIIGASGVKDGWISLKIFTKNVIKWT